jgi:parallel beta-helix repeat protein
MRKIVSIMMLTLLIVFLILMYNAQPVKTSGTIYIRADGSIDPPTAPIKRYGNVYTVTGNIYDNIVVQKDSIIIDGAGYTVQGGGSGAGIYLESRFNVTIKNLKVTKFGYGIRFDYTNFSIVSNVDSSYNNWVGIYLYYSNNNVILNCSTYYNGYQGIELRYSYNNNISKSAALYNNANGIVLTYSDDNLIQNNGASSNKNAGILVYYSENNNICNNTLWFNTYGVYVENSITNEILGNSIWGRITPSYGIRLYQSSKNNILENFIDNCTTGIWLVKSDYNVASRNLIVDNKVYLEDSQHNLISENTVYRDGIYVGGDFGSSCNIVTNNTIYGGPVSSAGIGPTIIIRGDNNVVSFNLLYAEGYSITGISVNPLFKNNTISNNEIVGATYGITLPGTESNHVFSNTIAGGDYGILLTAYISGSMIVESKDNTIANNIIYSVQNGIYLRARNSTLLNNTIGDCNTGITLYISNENIIMRNNLVKNSVGIYIQSSQNNSIYHNNFINNTCHVDSHYSVDFWDNGYPSGGNYWSGYAGVDLYCGPYQNVTGGDGIGDTPYTIDENNQDKYPLMSPWPSIHEISIINMTFSTATPKLNDTICIYVTVQNLGHFTETFDISVNYTLSFDPLIGTQTVIIAPGEILTLNFTWTPTASGRYEIQAYINEAFKDLNPQNNYLITHLYVSTSFSSSTLSDEMEIVIVLRSGRFSYLAYTA